MNSADIMTLIQTLGFPIVMCGLMAWYVKYMGDRNHDDMQKLNETHKDEIKNVTDALNNNTLAIQRLIDKLGD